MKVELQGCKARAMELWKGGGSRKLWGLGKAGSLGGGQKVVLSFRMSVVATLTLCTFFFNMAIIPKRPLRQSMDLNCHVYLLT